MIHILNFKDLEFFIKDKELIIMRNNIGYIHMSNWTSKREYNTLRIFLQELKNNYEENRQEEKVQLHLLKKPPSWLFQKRDPRYIYNKTEVEDLYVNLINNKIVKDFLLLDDILE